MRALVALVVAISLAGAAQAQGTGRTALPQGIGGVPAVLPGMPNLLLAPRGAPTGAAPGEWRPCAPTGFS